MYDGHTINKRLLLIQNNTAFHTLSCYCTRFFGNVQISPLGNLVVPVKVFICPENLVCNMPGTNFHSLWRFVSFKSYVKCRYTMTFNRTTATHRIAEFLLVYCSKYEADRANIMYMKRITGLWPTETWALLLKRWYLLETPGEVITLPFGHFQWHLTCEQSSLYMRAFLFVCVCACTWYNTIIYEWDKTYCRALSAG